jgi:hypothetical protein
VAREDAKRQAYVLPGSSLHLPKLDDPLRYRALGKIKTIFKLYKFIHDIVLMLETMRY